MYISIYVSSLMFEGCRDLCELFPFCIAFVYIFTEKMSKRESVIVFVMCLISTSCSSQLDGCHVLCEIMTQVYCPASRSVKMYDPSDPSVLASYVWVCENLYWTNSSEIVYSTNPENDADFVTTQQANGIAGMATRRISETTGTSISTYWPMRIMRNIFTRGNNHPSAPQRPEASTTTAAPASSTNSMSDSIPVTTSAIGDETASSTTSPLAPNGRSSNGNRVTISVKSSRITITGTLPPFAPGR